MHDYVVVPFLFVGVIAGILLAMLRLSWDDDRKRAARCERCRKRCRGPLCERCCEEHFFRYVPTRRLWACKHCGMPYRDQRDLSRF